jgi:DNA-directed RNA polymerase specialized sigma subunit
MTFTEDEHKVFQMRGINNRDNDTIAKLMKKNTNEIKTILKKIINKMKKKMMPEWLIAANLNMNVEDLKLYTDEVQPNETEIHKRLYELERNAECHKHTEEQLRMRVAQLEEQLDYRISRIEERVKLYCQPGYTSDYNGGFIRRPDM